MRDTHKKSSYAIGMKNMSKTYGVLLLAAFLLAIPICSIGADSHRYEKAEDVVAWIYRDFAFTTIMSDYWKHSTLIEQPKGILSLYFTDELVELILKDRKCVRETHEICNLDFDPIFASQDPGAESLQISEPDENKRIYVRFTYPPNGEKISLMYEVQKTNRGWRIKDIIYKDGPSLRKLLREPN